MQSHYPAQFVRDMGCTVDEWLKWLSAALPEQHWQSGQTEARIPIDASWGDPDAPCATGQPSEPGHLCLRWEVLPARQIALMRIPRLRVVFDFQGLSEATRTRFMRRLDLFLQRGGG